jgi:PAS domain S-box-containing protein
VDRELEELRLREREAFRYIREKVDQLLDLMGTAPLKPEELDDKTLLALDPIGIIGNSFAQILEHLKGTNLELKEARDEIAAIFDSAGAGILVLDDHMKVLAFNRKQEEFFSHPGEGVIGSTCCQVMCGGRKPPGSCTFERVMLDGEPYHQKDWLCGERHFNVVGTPIRNEDGKIARVVIVYTDITEIKRIEQDLRIAKEDLEQRNVELKKLDRMKDGLIRDVSHELKTPVAKHLMQMEVLRPLLSSDRLTEAERNSFTVMEESIRRQESVIRNLLDLARLESGERVYHKREVSLKELFDRVRKDYQYACEAYGAQFDVDIPAITVVTDEEMLWHVFSNLVNNAMKFRRRDIPAKIAVSAGIEGGEVVLRVADNGTGILPGERERVFEHFFQRTPSSEGSGVGLAICRRIIRDLGGRIWMESDGKDRGTTASVALPFAAE